MSDAAPGAVRPSCAGASASAGRGVARRAGTSLLAPVPGRGPEPSPGAGVFAPGAAVVPAAAARWTGGTDGAGASAVAGGRCS
ncbi:hypothetical protein [Streptomyces sp. BK208]|uniref:hypothetical protein n=1 Tax=Streptomyces sp. BK208 TaxID=2512150 RepID=UPI00105C2B56|nr:hypothetical protein [Streptomyces sp. BK208]